MFQPTTTLRFVEREYTREVVRGYQTQVYRVLQQWWLQVQIDAAGDARYTGEWRDVPLEKE